MKSTQRTAEEAQAHMRALERMHEYQTSDQTTHPLFIFERADPGAILGEPQPTQVSGQPPRVPILDLQALQYKPTTPQPSTVSDQNAAEHLDITTVAVAVVRHR